MNFFGAPQSMKMGTTRSPCPYDVTTLHALQSGNLRRPAICATPHRRAVSSRFRGMARLSFDGGPCGSIPGSNLVGCSTKVGGLGAARILPDTVEVF
jgi:hypothetical protein